MCVYKRVTQFTAAITRTLLSVEFPLALGSCALRSAVALERERGSVCGCLATYMYIYAKDIYIVQGEGGTINTP